MIWRLFKSKPATESKGMAAIMDDSGPFFISLEDRDFYLDNNMIYLTGYYRDAKGRLVWTYKMR
jgi:hypothetical protein